MNIDEFRKEIIKDVDGFMNSYAIRKFFLTITWITRHGWICLMNTWRMMSEYRFALWG